MYRAPHLQTVQSAHADTCLPKVLTVGTEESEPVYGAMDGGAWSDIFFYLSFTFHLSFAGYMFIAYLKIWYQYALFRGNVIP